MKAIFVELPAFERHRESYLDDSAFARFQDVLMGNPLAGDRIPSAGGLRKLRFRDERRGKGTRGGLRVIYYCWNGGPEFWLFAVYDKDEMEDLTFGAARHAEPKGQTVDREESIEMTDKRNLFEEINAGLDALAAQRDGKRTLRTHTVISKPAPRITPGALTRVRKKMNLSRGLFAGYLRTNVRTLENWEQGRATPNAQAVLLILLVQRYPDTMQRLAEI